MEKQHASKPKSGNNNNNNILKKMLPRALSSVAFAQNAPSYSPGRDHHKQRQDHGKTGNKTFFSGPIVSIVPVEARYRRSKLNDDALTDEPTSPKVSCIGQIKMAKKNKCLRGAETAPSGSKEKKTSPFRVKETQERKASGHVSKIKRMFSVRSRSLRKTETIAADDLTAPSPAPMLGQMRRFASGREAFSSFDWTAQISSGESDGYAHRDYHSDDEREHLYGVDEEKKARFSAPTVVDGGDRSGLKPKNEINLWKRRTADALGPLQIKGS